MKYGPPFMKRVFLILLFLGVCLSVTVVCADGFSDNPEQINLAAKSVMKLEALDKHGDVFKTGSGFVAFDNRHLITNYHVADEADMIYAYSDTGDLYIIMDVCISDSQKDIAILQFFSPTDLSPLELNETGEVTRASAVVAIGSPKGFTNTISTGIVSSVFEEGGCGYIQFTAPISSGSSGGALFNDDGKVIGITSMNYDDGVGANQNLNFAVDIKEVLSLYGMWQGQSFSLQEIQVSDIYKSESSKTIAPTKTPVPATEIPEFQDYQTVSAGEIYKNPDTYKGKIVDLMTSMSVVQSYMEENDYIILFVESDNLGSSKGLAAGSSIQFREDINSKFMEYYDAHGLVPSKIDVIAYVDVAN